MTMLRPSYVIHSHTADPLDITDRVVSGSWLRSTTAPFESGGFNFKLAYNEIGAIVNPGDWLVATDPAGFPYTFLHVDRVTYSISTTASAAVGMVGSVVCSSWMQLLAKSTMYVPKGDAETRGTLFSFTDWANVNGSVIGDYFVGPIGKALQAYHKAVARIRLPLSLGGGFLGDEIPIVYDDETLNMYAPDRIIDKVDKVSGLPNYLSFNFYTGSVLEAYFRLFVPEPMLIDLYPSIEHGGTGPMSPLANALNGRPVLIYTMKPWRAEPLYDAQTSYTTFNKIDEATNSWRSQHTQDAVQPFMGGVLGPSFSSVGRALKSAMDFRDKSLDAKRAFALSSSFTDVTMDPSRMKHIPTGSVRDITMAYSDEDRVNVSSISLTPAENTGVEALTSAGLPLTNDESIINHGARVAKPTWPFIPPVNQQNAFAGDVMDYLYAIAAQVMQFHVNSHKHATGVMRTDPLDAIIDRDNMPISTSDRGIQQKHRYVHLQAGEWFKTTFREGLPEFYGYVTSVTHDWSTTATGANNLTCSVSYTRGVSATDELTRKGKVPVGENNKPRPYAITKKYNQGGPFERTDAFGAPVLNFDYGAWTGQLAYTNTDKTIEIARSFNLNTVDIFANDLDSETGELYGRGGEDIPYVVDRFRSAGFNVYLTTWARPNNAILSNMAKLSRYAEIANVDGITLDLEEPWTIPARYMKQPVIDDWAVKFFEALRTSYTGRVGTSVIVSALQEPLRSRVAPILRQSDYCVPQAYSTIKNTRGVGPVGRLEQRSMNFSEFAPVYTGAWGMALRMDGSYGLPMDEAVAQCALAAYKSGSLGLRYWRLETLYSIAKGYNNGRRLIMEAQSAAGAQP